MQIALIGFDASPPDRFFDKIDSCDLFAASGRVQSRAARATPGIEYGTYNLVGNRDEGWLGFTDISGRVGFSVNFRKVSLC